MKIHNAPHDFPLTRNGERGWYKWIDGASRYICSSKLSADDAARYWYQNEKSIRARFKPQRRVRPDAMTLRDLVNKYLGDRRSELTAEKIGPAHYADLADVCKILLKTIPADTLVESLRPDDFAPTADMIGRLGTRKQRVFARIAITLFNHAELDEYVERSPNLGRRMKALANAKVEDKVKPVYSCFECRAILEEMDRRIASYSTKRPDLVTSYRQLKLLTLLALNGGFGMKDLAGLRVSDVRGDMIEMIRAKSKVQHRVPMWPETLALLTPMLDGKRQSDPIFRTRKGHALTRTRLKGMKAVTIDGPGQTFADLVADIGLKREDHGFYLLKHTHRSASGGAGDESAADVLVGHRLPGMRAIYQQVDETRLRRVADYLHAWLFTPGPLARPRSRAPRRAKAASVAKDRPARTH